MTDHRIRLTLAKLDRIIEGDLDELVTALRTSHQAELLRYAGVTSDTTTAGVSSAANGEEADD